MPRINGFGEIDQNDKSYKNNCGGATGGSSSYPDEQIMKNGVAFSVRVNILFFSRINQIYKNN